METNTLRGVLNARARRRALEAMGAHTLDVLVVGGGIVGAGAALDAASRGLSVALVEARDWASGTSSRSSRLIHGGLRYLEMLDFGLVQEALRERALLLGHVAPHLVRPVPFLYPLTKGWSERPYVATGLMLYDALALRARGQRLPHHQHLDLASALGAFPALSSAQLRGALQYWDAQVDDARYTLAVVRTAVAHGALAASRAPVVSLLREHTVVTGASLLDAEDGSQLEVRARHVVVAAGAWTDKLLARDPCAVAVPLRRSKGAHLLIERDRITGSCGLIERTEHSVLFVIPWEQHWLVGTTDTEWEHDPEQVVASGADVSYLLDQLNRLLAHPVGPEDITGVYAGVRPLIARNAGATAKLSRDHQVFQPAPGMTVVTGGKFTTYRLMARDAIDAAAAAFLSSSPPSRTECLPLLGADAPSSLERLADRLARHQDVAPQVARRLVSRYGSEAEAVLELGATDPRLRTELPECRGHLALEVVHAAQVEGALHLEDVLRRRTHLALECADGGVGAAEPVAEVLAHVLGWSSATTQRELAAWRASVAAERAARSVRGDDAAISAALSAASLAGS